MNKQCIICNSMLVNKMATFSDMCDRVQNLPKTPTDSTIDLTLYYCNHCSLVQFDCQPVNYYRDVIRAGGLSPLMRSLRKNQYEYFIDLFKLDGKKIWEVGCGGGEFLELLSEFDVESYGTENNEVLVEAARKKNLDVDIGFVGDETYVDRRGFFDAFLSFNFLEHQPNPVGMLRGIAANLTDGGVGIITVPAFEYLDNYGAYYEYMRDHIAYYTKESLEAVCSISGFKIIELSVFNEDTHQAIVQLKRKPISPNIEKQKASLIHGLNDYLKLTGTRRVALWGASHQGLTLCSTLKLGASIKYIIDSASFKWDCYAPGTNIRITSPSEFSEDKEIGSVIIAAPGYSKEIAQTIRKLRPDIGFICTITHGKVIML